MLSSKISLNINWYATQLFCSYDMPKEVDEYIHRCISEAIWIANNLSLQRIGRTGRVGNTGRATSFFDERENAGLARPLVKVTHNLFYMLSASGIIPLVFFTVTVWLNWPIIEGSYWCQAACARLAGWSIQGRLLLNCHHLKISFSISSESDKSPCYIDCIVACGLAGCFTVYFPFQCTISSSWIKGDR